MKILIATHANFATGLLSGYQMIAGKTNFISTISLTDVGVGKFRANFNKYLQQNSDEQILILTDVQGGTPYNEAYQYFLSHPQNIRLISGVNLPMLLEIGPVMTDQSSLEEVTQRALAAGQAGIQLAADTEDDNEIEF